MRWSKPRQRMAAKLQAIECAQKTAAEARLTAARREADEAAELARGAQGELDEAERTWTDRLAGGRLNLELQLSFSDELLRKDRAMQATSEQLENAEAVLDWQRHAWQQLETGVRAGDELLKRGRRFLSRRAEDARDRALSDQTTWKWFKR